jgi:C-terminal processing protease CtpA/Prc
LYLLGGQDFGCPLQIQNVNPNSLAERCGIKINDYIVKIGHLSTEYFQHHDAEEYIKRQNNMLNIILQRSVRTTKH